LDNVIVSYIVTFRWKEEQLIIDAYNPKRNKIVWEGIVKDEILNSSYAQRKI